MKRKIILLIVGTVLLSVSIIYSQDTTTTVAMPKVKEKVKATTSVKAPETTETAKEKEGGKAGGGEYVVKGTYKGTIKEKKPMIKLYFDPFDALATYIKKGEYIYDKQLRLNSDMASTLYPIFASDQVIKPWLHGIVRKEISLFNPVYGQGSVTAWKVFLKDEKGSLFKLWEGGGDPPRNIFWDGRGKDETMMNPGITYFYSAEAKDNLGNVSKVIGRELILKGLLYKEMGEWIVALRGDRVWESDGSVQVTDDGYILLREAADIVKELYTRKITIEVYSRDEALSRRRGEILMNYMLNNLVVPRYTVTHVSGFVDEVYNSSYIKIIL
ncbi:MAG: hypothetical protein HY769_03185 [Candidatus Stahlbacteria bacterium]|nr:hypothetical protein [Candidatus Stahlbacteria bacterium]